jgi:hypothetical protein
MIADLFTETYQVPWKNFRQEIENEMPNQPYDGPNYTDFWEIAYDKSKMQNISHTDNLVKFDTEEDAIMFVLKWS